MPVTILELASWRLKRDAVTGQDFYDAGLAIMGGCQVCGATLAAYNAYPSKTGYWIGTCCAEGCGDIFWDEVQEANIEIFGEDD